MNAEATMDQTDEASDLVPIKQAAKQVHKRVLKVKEMIEAGQVRAVTNGGDPEHPRLLVSLRELRQALTSQTYRPKRASHAAMPVPSASPTRLHPAAQRMLQSKRRRPARKAG